MHYAVFLPFAFEQQLLQQISKSMTNSGETMLMQTNMSKMDEELKRSTSLSDEVKVPLEKETFQSNSPFIAVA